MINRPSAANRTKYFMGARRSPVGGRFILALLLLSGLICEPAYSQWTWSGSTSASWDNSNNWLGPPGVSGNGAAISLLGTASSFVIDLRNSDRSPALIGIDSSTAYLIRDNSTPTNTLSLTSVSVANGTGHEFTVPILVGAGAGWNIASGADLEIFGSVSGSADLDKTGGGTLFLGAANTFSGRTTILDGTIALEDLNALQNSTVSVKIDGGLMLGVGGLGTTRLGALAGDGNFSIGSFTLAVGANDSNTTYSGIFSGSGGNLTKDGSGTLTLSGANTFSGTTQINAGKVDLGSMDALQNSTVQINVNNGLRLAGFTTTIGALEGSGDLDLLLTTLIAGGNDDTTVYSGVISGSGGLTKTGSGTLNLSGANSFSGTARINAGQIDIGHVDALKNNTVRIAVNNGLNVNGLDAILGGLAGSGAINIDSTQLDVGFNNNDTTYSGIITGNTDSGLQKLGTGTLKLKGSGSSFGMMLVEDGKLMLDGVDIALTNDSITDVFELDSDAVVANGSELSMTRRINVISGSLSVTGSGSQVTTLQTVVIRDGAVVVEDSGGFDANRANVASGVTAGNAAFTVNSGGMVDIASNTNVGQESDDTGNLSITGTGTYSTKNLRLGGTSASNRGGEANVTVDDGGALTVDGETIFYSSTGSMTIDGGTFSAGTLTNHTGVVETISISNPLIGSALTIGTNNGSSTFDGLIEDGGDRGGLKKTGTGTLTLTNANTFSGTTHIDNGKIILNNADALQNSTVDIQINDGLDITTNTIDATIGGLAGSGDLSLGSQELRIGRNDDDTIYSGALTGMAGGMLTKNGTGTLVLTGTGDGSTVSGSATAACRSTAATTPPAPPETPI